MKNDPLRSVLASANQAVRAAEDDARAAATALDEFEASFAETRTTFWQETEALETLNAERREALVAHAGSDRAVAAHRLKMGLPEFGAAIREAEARVAHARERYELAKEGQTKIEAAKDVADGALEHAKGKASRAAAAVEHTAIDALVKRARLLFDDLARTRYVLLHMSMDMEDIGWRSASGPFQASKTTAATRDCLNAQLPSHKSDLIGQSVMGLAAEALAPWVRAREALLKDAHAPLPVEG